MGSTKEREFKGTLPDKVLPLPHLYNVLFLLQNSTTAGSYYVFSPRKLHSSLFWPHIWDTQGIPMFILIYKMTVTMPLVFQVLSLLVQ